MKRRSLAWLGVVAVAGLVWTAKPDRGQPPSLVQPPTAETSSAGSIEQADVDAPPAPQPPPAIGAPPTDRPGFVKVCGLGEVKDSASKYTAPPALQEATEALRSRIVAAVLARGDDRSRVLAYLLQMAAPAPGYSAALADATADCGNDGQPVCKAEDFPEWRDAGQGGPARLALARLASTTTDPVVYAQAFQQCQKLPLLRASADGSGACAQVSTRRWAALDPDNGMVWLQVAAEAEERNDRVAIDDAMHRLSVAQSFQSLFGATAAAVLESEVEGGLAARTQLAVELLGIDAAVAIPGLQTVNQHCAADRMADANRRQRCDAIARRMVEQGDTLMFVSIGNAIGKRVGWASERVQRTRDEMLALQDLQVEDVGLGAEATMSCAALKRAATAIIDSARFGEVSALRRRAAASGQSVDQLIEAHRERVAVAALAASAASGAAR